MKQTPPLILIVDDISTNTKLVEGFLKHAGRYQYTSLNQSTAVFDYCMQHPVDMVLLDIMMPEMDGYQVCEQLKGHPATRDIPVIFLTAKHDVDSIVRGFGVGGVDYLIKPLNGMELLARVDTHLRLRQQERELIELNATKDRFLSIIAEDLHSPIRGLHGVLQMLDSKFDTLSMEQVREYLSLASLAADSLDAIAANLTQWSSLQVDAIPLQATTLDLHTLFGSLITKLQQESPHKQIHYQLNIEEGSFLTAAESALSIIGENILRNAAAYSHDEGEVSISTTSSDSHCTIRIRDNGIGIDPENLQRLFRMDQRFVRPGTSGESGSGLGLLLCKELLTRMGGEIGVTSHLNQGTEVTITLPINHQQ